MNNSSTLVVWAMKIDSKRMKNVKGTAEFGKLKVRLYVLMSMGDLGFTKLLENNAAKQSSTESQ